MRGASASLSLTARGAPRSFARQEQKRLAQDDKVWERGADEESESKTKIPRAVFIPQSSCFLWPIWKRAKRVINASQKHEASRGAPGSFARREQKRLAQDDKAWEWGERVGEKPAERGSAWTAEGGRPHMPGGGADIL